MQSEKKQAPPGPDRRPEDLNRNTEQFWKARGYPRRPADWETRNPDAPPDPSTLPDGPKK